MKLEEFITTTLTQIINGVRKAQLDTKDSAVEQGETGLVNPRVTYGADDAPKGKHYATSGGNVVQMVDFDVAVTTQESADVKAGFGVFVAGIGLGTKGGVSSQDSAISRIKFQVPIALPRSQG